MNDTATNYWSKEVTSCLKGYLCICILIHHLYQFTGFFAHSYFGHFLSLLGSWSASLFLFLSGYGLFYSYLHNRDHYLRTFLRHRFLPLYGVYLLLNAMSFLAFPQTFSVSLVLRSILLVDTAIGFGWFFLTIFALYLLFYLSFRFVSKPAIGFGIFCALATFYGYACYLNNRRYLVLLPFLFGMLIARFKKQLDKIMERYVWLLLFGSFIVFFTFYMIHVCSVVMALFTLPTASYLALGCLSDLAMALFVMSFCYLIGRTNCPILINPISKGLSAISLEIYGCQAMVLFRLYPHLGNSWLFVLCSLAIILVLALGVHLLQIGFTMVLRRLRSRR